MITGRNETVSPGGYCDLYLLHRLTLFWGVKNSNFIFFCWGGGGGWEGGGWNYSKYFLGMQFASYILGLSDLV